MEIEVNLSKSMLIKTGYPSIFTVAILLIISYLLTEHLLDNNTETMDGMTELDNSLDSSEN